MLISLKIKNFLSFRDATELSLIAGDGKGGEHHVAVPRKGLRLLPAAVIYGGNAAGKSNLFKAAEFLRNFVVGGTRLPEDPIPVRPFRLDGRSREAPSEFAVRALIGKDIYEYVFKIDRKAVKKETLKRNAETLFSRDAEGKVTLSPQTGNDRSRSLLRFVAQNTRPNQLFLTASVLQNQAAFREVYEWFRTKIVLVSPESVAIQLPELIGNSEDYKRKMTRAVASLDTGIADLRLRKVPLESIPVPKEIIEKYLARMRNGQTMSLRCERPGDDLRFLLTMKDGEGAAYKLVGTHRADHDGMEDFDMDEESAGTRRILDLLPAFLDLAEPKSDRVYFVDEIDRCLHPLLVQKLMEDYLSARDATRRAQIVFTTHDLLLMRDGLFRVDEMWAAERDADGASTLIPFYDFLEAEDDPALLDSYLDGRLGGIPRAESTIGADAMRRAEDGE